MPRNWCIRRKRLYQPQLDQTETFLGQVAQRDARLAPALADQGLIDALEAMLIPYVVYGVARDLARLRESKVLYIGQLEVPPDVSVVLGAQDLQALPAGYRPIGQVEIDKVGPDAAYYRYFSWFIDRPDQNGRSGEAAFFARYPVVDYAVRTIAQHYQQNIDLACRRILRNWDDIQRAFFPNRTLQRLLGIKSTGNDFHKGGKQVLILSFELDRNGTGQVVYKPSAVEIDCRIVGNSAVFQAVQPRGPTDAQGFTQLESLSELINRHRPASSIARNVTSKPLPTYRILPYNRASVTQAYGYLEFLSHEPDLGIAPSANVLAEAGKEIARLGPFGQAVATSDWITIHPEEALVFYHQLGSLAAMALAVSLCDLHVQNLIVHAGAPYLIDLEEALKRPMTSVTDTYLIGDTGPLNVHTDPASPQLKIWKDRTDKMAVGGWDIDHALATSALWVLDDPTCAHPAPLWPPSDDVAVANRKALSQGFSEVAQTIATQANNDVRGWVQGLGGTLARYVTVATGTYAQALRLFYQASVDYPGLAVAGPRQQDPWYGSAMPSARGTPYFVGLVTTRVEDWTTRRGKVSPTWNPPFFVLEHPDHVWFDYLNCDIPCFYHRLGSDDLLNSSGNVVDAGAALNWQRANAAAAKGLPAAWPRTQYLPGTATTVIDTQLNDLSLTWADAGRRRKWLAAALPMATLNAALVKHAPLKARA